jgi:hypothetical protein
MFKFSVDPTQTSDSPPFVYNPEPVLIDLADPIPDTAQQTSICDSDNDNDCPWISRLAAEWQVGIETLVPMSQSEALLQQLARSFDTTNGTIRRESPARIELGFAPEIAAPQNPYRTVASTTYLSAKLLEAVQSGVVSTVEQVLLLINSQSQASTSVLLDLKDEYVRNARAPLTIDLETGKNTNGVSFTRLSFLMVNDWTNDSGATRLVIGSDHNTYATHTETWNSTPVYLSPDDVISSLRECTPKRVRNFNKPPHAAFNIKSATAPRHFKAAG